VPLWLTAVVIGRDLAIVIGGFAYQWLVGEVHADPTWISKVNTFVQIIFVLSVVAQEAFQLPGEVAIIVLGTAVFVSSMVSGLDYIWTWGGRALANRGKERTAV
jgi:cardiolipin synthase